MSPLSLLILSFSIPEKYAGKIPGIGTSFLLPGKYFLLKQYRYSLSSLEDRARSLENGMLSTRTFLDFCLQWKQARKIRLVDMEASLHLALSKALENDGVLVFDKKTKESEILIFDPLDKIKLRRLIQSSQVPSQELV